MAESTPIPTIPAVAPTPRRGPRRHAWWLLLLFGAPLLVGYQVAPQGLARDLVYVASGIAAVGGILLGVRMHQPVRRSAWLALSGSQALWTIADLVAGLRATFAPTEAFPTVADIPYLAGYPLLGLSLYLLTRGRRPRRDLEGILDSLTMVVGLYLLCWVLLAKPIIMESRDSWLAAVVGAAYPLLDLAAIAMLVALAITPGTRTGALRLLCMAIALVMVADTTAAALGQFSFGSTAAIDFIWMLSYLLVGSAGLHPSMQELSAPTMDLAPHLSGRRQVATVLAVLVAPSTLAVEHALGLPLDVWAVVIASVLMLLLVVARMNLAVRKLVAADARRERAQRALAHEAAHDALTGLPNRAQALKLVGESLSRAQRSGAVIGLLFVDLDGFKTVNDTFGHRAGDEVLFTLALRMQDAVRAGDLVGRLGGDEFVVLLEPVVDAASAVGVGERLIAEVSKPIPLTNGQQVKVGASVGVAISQDGGTDSDALLVEADVAAYRAKERGKGRTEVFDAGLRREMQAQTDLVAGLGTALAEEQLLLLYQPVVDLGTGLPVGYEAVAHWNRPGVGLVPVPQLREAAEVSDLVFDLDAWALRRAAEQVAEWQRQGHRCGQVAVRVSIRHTKRARLIQDVHGAAEAAGIRPQQLIVQISDLHFLDDAVSFRHLVAAARRRHHHQPRPLRGGHQLRASATEATGRRSQARRLSPRHRFSRSNEPAHADGARRAELRAPRRRERCGGPAGRRHPAHPGPHPGSR